MKRIITTILWGITLSLLLLFIAVTVGAICCYYALGSSAPVCARMFGRYIFILFSPIAIICTAWVGVAGILPGTRHKNNEGVAKRVLPTALWGIGIFTLFFSLVLAIAFGLARMTHISDNTLYYLGYRIAKAVMMLGTLPVALVFTAWASMSGTPSFTRTKNKPNHRIHSIAGSARSE